MQIVNSFSELGTSLALETGTSGIFVPEMKKDGGFHAGHQLLLDQLQAQCDILVVSTVENINVLFDYLFGDETDYYAKSISGTTFDANDRTYVENKLVANGIDYYYPISYTTDFMDDLFSGYNKISLRNEIDAIISSENYAEGLIGNNINLLRSFLIIRLLMHRKNLYTIDKRFTSWKDGLARYYEKDFCDKYTNFEIVILGAVNKTDTIVPLSTYVNNLSFDSPILTKLKSIYRDLNNNIASITETKIQNRVPLVDPDWIAENVVIYDNGVVGQGNRYVEFTIRQDTKTFPISKLFEGVI